MEVVGNLDVTNHDWFLELTMRIYEVSYSVEQELEQLDGTSVTLRLLPQQCPQNWSNRSEEGAPPIAEEEPLPR